MTVTKKTTTKRHKVGKDDGVKFSKENQPSPEAKSMGWQEKRAAKLLTQKIIEKLTEGKNLDEYFESLLKNAKAGNPKAIDTINNGLEEQISKTDITSGGKEIQPVSFVVKVSEENKSKLDGL